MSNKRRLVVAHSADWHLLEIQYGQRERSNDFFAAAANVIAKASQLGAHAIVLGGDVLNKPVMSAGLFKTLKQLNRLLESANLDLLVVTGNHDAGNPHWFSAFSEDMPNSRIISLGVTGPRKIGSFTIAGIDHTGVDDMLPKIQAMERADVLVAHLAIDVVSSGARSTSTVQAAAIPLERFGYIACGDIHIPATATFNTPLGITVIGMPGSTEITQNGEPIDKSFFLVTLEAEGDMRPQVVDIKRIPIDSARPVVPIHIAHEKDMDSAIARLRAVVDQSPLVFIRFNPEVPEVRSRINSVLAGSNAIIRSAPFEKEHRAPNVGRIAPTREKNASLIDAMEALCPQGSRVHDIAVALLKNPTEADRILDAYVEKHSLLTTPIPADPALPALTNETPALPPAIPSCA